MASQTSSCSREVIKVVLLPTIVLIAAATLSSMLGNQLAMLTGSEHLTLGVTAAITALGSLILSIVFSIIYGPTFFFLFCEILNATHPLYLIFLAACAVSALLIFILCANCLGSLALSGVVAGGKDEHVMSTALSTGPVGGSIVGFSMYILVVIFAAGRRFWHRRKQEKEEEEIEMQRFAMEVERLRQSVVSCS